MTFGSATMRLSPIERGDKERGLCRPRDRGGRQVGTQLVEVMRPPTTPRDTPQKPIGSPQDCKVVPQGIPTSQPQSQTKPCPYWMGGKGKRVGTRKIPGRLSGVRGALERRGALVLGRYVLGGAAGRQW